MDTKSEIFSQRLFSSVLWNITLQIFIAVILVFFIQADPLHPISWVSSTVNDIIAWKMSLNIVLLGLVSFFQAYIYGSYYMTPPPKYFSRFSIFLNLFSLQNLTFGILYVLSGYFTMGLYSSLAKSNYSILKKKCEHYDGQCLIEPAFFLQFGGMWMGLYYFLNVHIFKTPMLFFPHIYQDKFQQIKVAVSEIISMGFRKSIAPVAYYCIFYYIWGSKPRNVVSDVYSLYLEDPPLDNIINMFKTGICIGLWFYTSLFFISVYAMKTVFNIVLTEPMKFPIESGTSLTLCNALAQTSKFNGYLGTQDLKILSIKDPSRRSEIFTLSQPGGHPRNWKNLLEHCLNIINSFNKELNCVNGDMKLTELEKSVQKKMLDGTPYPGYSRVGEIRNMANSPELFESKNQYESQAAETFSTVMNKEFNNLLKKLCQKPGINYFFGELTDAKLKFLFLKSQPVMWTCEGLAFITAASLTEDKYGIVQNDLPIILSALIDLKHNLDKLTKPGLVSRKLNDSFALKIKSALMSSVKRSIYKIVNTFSKYMNEIPLNSDVQVALQPFLFFKEA